MPKNELKQLYPYLRGTPESEFELREEIREKIEKNSEIPVLGEDADYAEIIRTLDAAGSEQCEEDALFEFLSDESAENAAEAEDGVEYLSYWLPPGADELTPKNQAFLLTVGDFGYEYLSSALIYLRGLLFELVDEFDPFAKLTMAKAVKRAAKIAGIDPKKMEKTLGMLMADLWEGFKFYGVRENMPALGEKWNSDSMPEQIEVLKQVYRIMLMYYVRALDEHQPRNAPSNSLYLGTDPASE